MVYRRVFKVNFRYVSLGGTCCLHCCMKGVSSTYSGKQEKDVYWERRLISVFDSRSNGGSGLSILFRLSIISTNKNRQCARRSAAKKRNLKAFTRKNPRNYSGIRQVCSGPIVRVAGPSAARSRILGIFYRDTPRVPGTLASAAIYCQSRRTLPEYGGGGAKGVSEFFFIRLTSVCDKSTRCGSLICGNVTKPLENGRLCL